MDWGRLVVPLGKYSWQVVLSGQQRKLVVVCPRDGTWSHGGKTERVRRGAMKSSRETMNIEDGSGQQKRP